MPIFGKKAEAGSEVRSRGDLAVAEHRQDLTGSRYKHHFFGPPESLAGIADVLAALALKHLDDEDFVDTTVSAGAHVLTNIGVLNFPKPETGI